MTWHGMVCNSGIIPRGVTRRSRVFFNELRGVLNQRKSSLPVFERTSQTSQYFCEKMKEKVGLVYTISSSDFQTFSTELIFFVYELLIVWYGMVWYGMV